MMFESNSSLSYYVTMAMVIFSISSHVKDKNIIFTARDEDTIFSGKTWYFTSDYSGAPAAEGRQAEPHTHIRKLKGTHELIFSCVSWLAVLLVGAYARRRRRRRRRWWSRATWRPQLTRKPKRGFSFRGLSL